MFTEEFRQQIKSLLVERAQNDTNVVAAGYVGSAARGAEDRWSDIDLSLQLGVGVEIDQVAADWTRWAHRELRVADTLDIWAAGALYRVFLLENSLQIDLSFYPHDSFRGTNGEPLLPAFGAPPPLDPVKERDWQTPARMGWLYLVHARSALQRERVWQCDMMLAELRHVILALAAQRHKLRCDHGREAHLLPDDVSLPLAAARATSIDLGELRRSLIATAGLYRAELRAWHEGYADQIDSAIEAIVRSVEVESDSPSIRPGADHRYRIRRARAAVDGEPVRRLSDEFARRERDSFRTPGREFNRIVGDTNTLLVVAEYESHLVGYLLGSLHASLIADRPVVWVEELYVRPDHRSNGVGRMLLAAADSWGASVNASHIALATAKAGTFYERIGYRASASYYKRYLEPDDAE